MAALKNFCKGAYTLGDRKLAHQECINLYPEINQGVMSLQPTGGYEDLFDYTEYSPSGYIRGIYLTSRGLGQTDRNPLGDIITVIDDEVLLYQYSDNSYTFLGNVTNTLNLVSMADDGTGIIIVDGEAIYRVDMDSLEFTLPEFDGLKPTKVVSLNFRTIVVGNDTPENIELNITHANRYYFSDVDDNSTWGALNFYEMSKSRENITNIKVIGGYLYLYGVNTREIWQTNTNSKKPFLKRSSSSDDIGLHAVDSLTDSGGVAYFIGSIKQGSPLIYAANESGAKKISTTALDTELSGTSVRDAVGYSFTENGHEFVVFCFDGLNKTYVYDVTLKEWHRRTTRTASGIMNQWAPRLTISYNGDTLFGSATAAKIYRYSPDILTKPDGTAIFRLRSTPNISNETRAMVIHRITVACRTGAGVQDTLVAPTLMMRYATDGGYVWSSRLTTSLGRTGDYMRQVEFRKLGVCRQFQLEVSTSDIAKISFHEAFIYSKVSGSRG